MYYIYIFNTEIHRNPDFKSDQIALGSERVDPIFRSDDVAHVAYSAHSSIPMNGILPPIK